MARLLLPRGRGRLPVTGAVLALALCVLAVGGLLSGAVDERPWVVTLPVAAVSTLAVVGRRRAPIALAVVVSVLSVGQAVLADHSPQTLWALVVLLVCSYSVAAERDEGWASVGLVAVLVGQFLGEWLDHTSDYAFDTLVFGGVWLFGRGTRSWRMRATYAEGHQRDLARLAVAQERTRIARELHDVVAHSLSVIAVQADAAEAALGRHPERVGEPLVAIRSSAREALADMRSMLHVLRADDSADDGARQPSRGLGDLPRLVEAMRESGLCVEMQLDATRPMPQATQLAVFRIVQEGLTNVLKHAGPVATRVAVIGFADRVVVSVIDEGVEPLDTGLSTGHGLVGVRERVLAMGGTVRAGRRPAGGFELVAELPLDVAAVPA